MLLVKVALSGISPSPGRDRKKPSWRLRRAAQKAHEINGHLLRDLLVTQVQLDEMWSFIRRKHAQQAAPDGSSELSEDGDGSGCGSVLPQNSVLSLRPLSATDV